MDHLKERGLGKLLDREKETQSDNIMGDQLEVEG